MSAMIKGIEIPNGCYYCPILQSSDGCFDFECPFNSYLLWHNAEDVIRYRPDSCPLVEIPTPHGRLIDADELIKKLERHRDMCGDIEIQHGIDMAIRILNNTPTIIEAEVSE